MSPFISVVIPACNEESVIDIPVKRALEAFKTYGYKGEILIMDSSTDKTSEIAESLGCRVVRLPKQGLGKAYIEARKHVKGDYIVMGDADGTYDFMEMDRFVKKMDEGYDFVMGTRLKGDIHPKAMPFTHRYVGTPILTAFINLFFRTGISDCNSGLRALTKSAYEKIDIISWGWEYASEMVVKAKIANLKMTEVPVSLLPDSRGRIPLLNPLNAGYTNLRVIFLLASDRLFLKAGVLLWLLGTLIFASQVFGEFHLQGMKMGMYYLFLGFILSAAGFSLIQVGVLTQLFSFIKEFHQSRLTRWVRRVFSFEKGLLWSLLCLVGGVSIISIAFYRWLQTGIITQKEIKIGLYSVYFISLSLQLCLFSFTYYLFDITESKNDS